MPSEASISEIFTPEKSLLTDSAFEFLLTYRTKSASSISIFAVSAADRPDFSVLRFVGIGKFVVCERAFERRFSVRFYRKRSNVCFYVLPAKSEIPVRRNAVGLFAALCAVGYDFFGDFSRRAR